MLQSIVNVDASHANLFLSRLAWLAPVLLFCYLLLNEVVRHRARNPHFNGPRGLPVIGNLRELRLHAPSKLQEWAGRYGDVFQVQLGNSPVLVVNSAAAARELFGGSNAHALGSRPMSYTFHRIVAATAGATIGTSPLSDDLKRRRRGAAAALNKPSVNSYAPHLDVETAAFVRDLLEHGAGGETAFDPLSVIQRFALSMVLTVNWGTRMASDDSGLFKEIIEVEAGIVATRSTTTPQDHIPLLRLNPFSGDSRRAAELRRRRDAYLRKFDDDLRRRVEAGTHSPCIQANCMLDPDAKLTQQDLTTISISLIQGGVETVVDTMAWSIAMLATRPDIQTKALAAIRELHGPDGALLCDAGDQERCAYVAALVRECLRYFTVLRLSLPRANVADITFRGRPISAGSTVWLNAWACNTDDAVWADPLVFRPERWLEKPDAPLFTYGLGYRMCAGYALANRELYLLLMRLVSCFEVVAVGELDVHPVTGSASALAPGRKPMPYRVFFRPRDRKALERELLDK